MRNTIFGAVFVFFVLIANVFGGENKIIPGKGIGSAHLLMSEEQFAKVREDHDLDAQFVNGLVIKLTSRSSFFALDGVRITRSWDDFYNILGDPDVVNVKAYYARVTSLLVQYNAGLELEVLVGPYGRQVLAISVVFPKGTPM
jgi:hypothetical protein